MTRFLLDSNFCIACLRRKAWALQVLGKIPLASVAVSAITVGELVLGTHLSGDSGLELAKVEAFLRPIQVLPFGWDEAFQWASIDAQLRKHGNRIETEDAMIAATALAFGMTLVSGNIKHFERVKGLKVVDWEQLPPKGLPVK
ncbi:MAG: type II toxin-antitoxin system VapC family toxin [Holophagaceae bacterium]|nr:type II toxin-antitoxin system VapC family toxin [Holophagaceae bacterium]